MGVSYIAWNHISRFVGDAWSVTFRVRTGLKRVCAMMDTLFRGVARARLLFFSRNFTCILTICEQVMRASDTFRSVSLILMAHLVALFH